MARAMMNKIPGLVGVQTTLVKIRNGANGGLPVLLKISKKPHRSENDYTSLKNSMAFSDVFISFISSSPSSFASGMTSRLPSRTMIFKTSFYIN